MTTDFLDDLKNDWKAQKSTKTFEQEQIVAMLGKKSKNSLRWLVIITLVEILLGVGAFIYFILFGNKVYDELKEINAGGAIIYHQLLVYLGLIFSLVMFAISWYYYKRISPNLPIKKLINRILNFRKWIHIAIFVSAGIGIVLSSIYTYQVGYEFYFIKFDASPDLAEAIAEASQFAWIIVGVFAVTMIIFLVLYYGLLYGLFLRRLRRNYYELKRLEA